jgi:hypothetical protein
MGSPNLAGLPWHAQESAAPSTCVLPAPGCSLRAGLRDTVPYPRSARADLNRLPPMYQTGALNQMSYEPAERVGLGPTRPLRARRFSGPLPSSGTRLASPGRMAQDSNLSTAPAVTTGFQPGTLPTRSAIRSGERRTRIPCPCGHDPASNRSRRACPAHSPCVPSPGLEPGRRAV